MRKGLLTLICAGCALAAPLLLPGSALASSPLTITNNATSAGVAGGANDCTFTANVSGENVYVGNIETCLANTHSVMVVDNAGGEIDVDYPISSTCSGTSLTLNEQDSGPIDINDSIAIGTCSLALESPGAITEGQAETITAGIVNVTSGGDVDLSHNGANSNAFQTLNGAVSGTLAVYDSTTLSIGALSAGNPSLSVTSGGALTVDGAVSDSGTVSLTAAYPDGIDEESGGSVEASTLDASGPSGITLGTAGNQILTFEGTAENGTVDLVDNSSGGLTLDGAVGPTGVNITNTGGINSAAQVNAAPSDASLTSTGGSVIANTGVFASQLTVSGTSVSVTGSDFVSRLNATASAGDVTADLYEPASTLGNVEASGGSVSVDNADGSLDPSGTISGQSVALTADGFVAGGQTGSLAAPNISITDSDAGDAWTVTPSSIMAQGEPIAYTGASNLSIGGGAKTFNVTPSTSTAMSFNGGSPAAGTLNYNAQGGTVSGTTTPTSGTIDNSKFEPVAFSGMTAVNVTDAATPPSTGGSTGTGTGAGGSSGTGSTTTTTTTTTSPNAPSCTLRASSSKIALPRRVHGKLKGKATLTLIANCAGAVHTTLNLAFTVVDNPAHKKAKSKSYGVNTINTTLRAGVATKIVVDVPSAVVKALSTKGDKLSAEFTLADSDDHDDVLKDATVARLT